MMNPRAEKLTVGILSVLAIIGAAFVAGGEWRDLLGESESQQEQINSHAEIIGQINTSLQTISKNLSAVSTQIKTSRVDPWRGEDMREYGEAAADMNDGWEAPNIYALPGVRSRNEADRRR